MRAPFPPPRDPPLSREERRTLAAIAAVMIPASAAHRVPGADDPAILADMLATLGADTGRVRSALERLDALAGGRFADLAPEQRKAVAETFRSGGGFAVATLNRVVAQAYYRDDRVMRSLGMEPRPPFPKGFEIEPGDWSLLDPVRARGKVYRDAT